MERSELRGFRGSDYPGFRCAPSRPRCKEMSSCEEARYYLNICGVKQLDGDGDGRPCESLCQN
ncbi:MAG: excalibur calcium-binding domain-containing protein [Methylococcus sp.]